MADWDQRQTALEQWLARPRAAEAYATPQNPILGAIANALMKGTDTYKSPLGIQGAELLKFLAGGAPEAVEKLSYGEGLRGSGAATSVDPQMVELANLIPFGPGKALKIPEISPTLKRGAELFQRLWQLGHDAHYLGNEDWAVTKLGHTADNLNLHIPYDKLSPELQDITGTLGELREAGYDPKELRDLAFQMGRVPPPANAP